MRRIMSSEQRTKHRDLTALSLMLHHGDGDPIQCKALNLSIAGMLLDFDGSNMEIGSSVDILVSLQERELVIPAVVIHHNRNCMGIRFRKPQADFYRTVTGSMRYTSQSVNSHTPIHSAV